MPLYSDSNYYYSGGSSQLYSPYYSPGAYTSPTTSYTSSYNRAIGGSYVVPLTPPRSPTYTTHALSSRYQPKLSTITEMGNTRHNTLIPLTRLQSPKFSTYSASSTTSSTLGSKYIPPRPIAINTADLDVSKNSRFRKHPDEEKEVEKKKDPVHETLSPTSSIKRQGSNEVKGVAADLTTKIGIDNTAEQTERKGARSTIKRNRAVVRLSTVRSRSKDRKSKAAENEPDEKKFKDLPNTLISKPEVKLSWREKLADDLAAIPTGPARKTPGDIIRERYLIQVKSTEEVAPTANKRAAPVEETIEQVLIEVDPLHHTVRRLSNPQCPTFHEICEDISSDKIDDDLNAGQLRRRASLIQEQEHEIINQLQKSQSGTYQFIHLERQGSHESLPDECQRKSLTKRKSKRRSKKAIRHKITATVEVENSPTITIIQESAEEDAAAMKQLSPKPKFSCSVDAVEEHHQIHKIFKLPKKRSVKKQTKPKDIVLPEGFVQAQPKVKSSPKTPKTSEKKEKFISTAEIFTFDQASVKEVLKDEDKQKAQEELKIDTPKIEGTAELVEAKHVIQNIESPKAPLFTQVMEPNKTLQCVESPKTPKTLKSTDAKSMVQPIESPKIPLATQVLEPNVALQSIETPKTPKLPQTKNEIQSTKVLSPAETKKETILSSKPEIKSAPSEDAAAKMKNLKKSQSLNKDETTTSSSFPPSVKHLEKSQSLNVDDKQASVASPKPIRKAVQKSESGEDFWTQIGTRETIYMTNRKKVLSEYQSENSEKSQIKEEENVLEEPKTVAATQSKELAKNSNDKDVLKDKEIKPGEKLKETLIDKAQANDAKSSNKKTSPTKVVSPKKDQLKIKPQAKTKELSVAKVGADLNDKKTTTPPPPLTKTTIITSATTSQTLPTSITTTPKINTGQKAKSPEQANKFATTPTVIEETKIATTITAVAATKATKVANTVDKTSINKTATTTTETIVAPTEKSEKAANNSLLATSTQTTAANIATNSQPEFKITKITEISKKRPSPQKTTIAATSDKSKLPATKQKVATSATDKPNAAKTSPTATPINVDQFFSIAPPAPKVAVASPTNKTKVAANASPTATKIATTATLEKTKTTTKTTATTTTTIASTPATKATTATTATAATIVAATATTATATKTTATTTTTAVPLPKPDNGGGSGGNKGDDNSGSNNLSKFATVSNLAQYLQDVDADLEDYIPSSAENSDNDSLSDYSSVDGCENLSESMKKKLKQRRKKEKAAEKARFDPKKKITIDPSNKCYVKEETPRYPLVATPRPLWKREKIVYPAESDEDSDSDEDGGSTEDTEDSEECSTTSEEFEDELNPSASSAGGAGSSSASTENSAIIRMSTCSNDSGFEGGTAPSSPKKMLECDVNCHKKCERLTANLCGVNQKLIVEALASVRRGAQEVRDSPSTPPSSNPVYEIETNEEQDETSYTYSQFQKSGRFTAPATVIPRFKTYSVDDFHFLAVLGKGSFGKVLLAELRNTEYYYAVKCLKKDVVLEDDDVDSTLIERKVLALGTKHPYLCHLFCTFQTESHLFFVMEYLNGGDLMFHIQESGRFPEERARFYGAEIISGLKFLHKKGIIYRDLKLDNVLLDFDGHVRIADFGMCKLQIYLDKTADSFCGTPDYMAPEIIKGEKYNQNVDWWSFGVLLYEMLIGQSPFSGCDEDELFWSICNEIPWFPVYITAEATSILKGLLEKDYTKRVGSQYSPAGDIAEHIFFRPIDWNLLDKRQLEPPFKPQVKHPLDTQYFDRVFTRERVRLTPIDKEILQSMDQKQFHGFSYTNPHITLD